VPLAYVFIFHSPPRPPTHLTLFTPCPLLQPAVKLLLDGEFVQAQTSNFMPVVNPATQETISRLPLCSAEDVAASVASAKAAFPKWAATPVPQRARVMFKLHSLINQHMDELAACVTQEQGKTLADARGDVFRGLEVVEFAAGIAPFLQGDTLENVSTGIDTYSLRQPLGVTAGLCPFNFPAMSELTRKGMLAKPTIALLMALNGTNVS
jgi:malonate-semialdehyde dehydrogenase (acetylating) / methylmalonate-semialdehyde dehydrogenase